MVLITLNRHTYTAYDGNSNVILKDPQSITINPQYIVSMVEHFNISKEFDFTELNLSNDTYYYVTSRIEEIVEMINCADMIATHIMEDHK